MNFRTAYVPLVRLMRTSSTTNNAQPAMNLIFLPLCWLSSTEFICDVNCCEKIEFYFPRRTWETIFGRCQHQFAGYSLQINQNFYRRHKTRARTQQCECNQILYNSFIICNLFQLFIFTILCWLKCVTHMNAVCNIIANIQRDMAGLLRKVCTL